MKKMIAALCIALLSQQAAVYASDLSTWAVTDYESAARAGLLSYNVAQKPLSGNITREEFCVLAMNLYKTLSDKEVYTPDILPFEDSENEAVAQAYALGIINGRSETEFEPEGLVTREEMAKVLVNTLRAAEINLVTLRSEAEDLLVVFDDADAVSDWAFSEIATVLKYSLMSGISDTMIAPRDGASREQALAMVNRVYTQFAPEKVTYSSADFLNVADGVTVDDDFNIRMLPADGAKKYFVIVKDSEFNPVKTIESDTPEFKLDVSGLNANMNYTITSGVRYASGIEVFSIPADIQYKPLPKQITVINKDKATLTAKGLRVFPGGYMFETEEEAADNMTTVTVDVWSIDKNGEKHAVKKSLQVNQFLAEDVVNIFKEIFEDPSKFPIKSVGGYCWRTTAFGSVSQHSYGTCIDINPDENYYCYSADGKAITGTHWKPYEDIYSITPDGAVVAAFAKYGWTWGGDWDGSVKDYMHFTYLGK